MVNLIILDTERKNFPSNKILSAAYNFLEDNYLKIIYRYFIIPKTNKLLRKNQTIIVAADKETELTLQQEKINFKKLRDYITPEEYLRFEKKTIKYIRELPLQFPLIDQKYMNISQWYANENHILYSFLRFPLTTIDIIDQIIKQENVKKITILNSTSNLGMVLKGYKKKIKVNDSTNIISKVKQLFFSLLIPFAITTIGSGILKTLKKANFKPTPAKDIVLFEGERSFLYSYPFLKQFKNNVTVLHLEDIPTKKEGINIDNINHYVNEKTKRRIISLRKKLKKKLKRILKSNHFKTNVKYNGVLIYPLLEEMIHYLFLVGYVQGAYYSECLTNFLQQRKPKLILTTGEEPLKNRIMVSLSKANNIPSLLVLHGTVGERDLFDNIISNKIAVYGPYYKKVLMEMNNQEQNVIVTGNPAWDKMGQNIIPPLELKNKLNLPQKKAILLINAHFPWDVRNRIGHLVVKSMQQFPEYHLIVKLHPEEKPDFYQGLLKKYKVKGTITDSLKLLHSLVLYSELVIVNDSTVGLETILLGKPLIDLRLSTMPYWNDYVKEGVAVGVQNEQELVPAIKSLLKNKKSRTRLLKEKQQYIIDHNYKQDGNAANRVAKIIKTIIKNN